MVCLLHKNVASYLLITRSCKVNLKEKIKLEEKNAKCSALIASFKPLIVEEATTAAFL